ncbi:unnamed protein product [Microthlaspi erraticum]|uniref:DUF4378 domain-containing protein n=1 Tax=Microthlaspi erraticum TaxID=1685480 RepID=A0A6D2J2I4_9BRAS|nr:unnamed protein product [Microthlaspi erraticum]
MGRDWSWLGGGGGKKKSSSKSKKDIKTTPPVTSPAGNTATAAGCMSAVFNIFDLQHLQFPLNHHHLHLPKGVDAPRNSLESTEEETPCSPTRKDGNLNISMGIKIKTKPQARSSSSPSPSSLTATESYSPSVKTPTLVARLMGLDLVPDNYRSSPTPSSSSSSLIELKTPTRSSHTNKHRHYSLQRNSIDGGTRSLPETPRISLGRRSVDVINCYEHQRSSLLHLRDNNNNNNNNNINVLSSENNIARFTRVKEMKIHEDKENRSPREYARQIVMQLKENVSRRRRMGADITNTTRSSKDHQHSREMHEPKKASSKITTITHDSSSSSSPRLGSTETPKTKPPQANNVASKILETRLPPVQEEKHKQRRKPENFKSRLVKPPQTMQEEPFVRSPAAASNKHNGLINFTTVPSLHTIKKKDSPPHKSSNLYVDSLKLRETQSSRNRASSELFPSFPSQSQTHIAPPIAAGELEYITRALRRTGVDRDTPVSYAKWFSPSHPLDPSIFYFLEHFAITRNSPEDLALRCNRKLLFHLADELLADILKPRINLKPWVCRYPVRSRGNLKGSELIDELSRRIERFPLAECLVLEDIDSLVAGDFPETATQTELAFEEEGEGIVTELERGILETLVTETMTDCYDTWIKTAPLKRNDDVSGTWGVHVTRYPPNDGSHHDSSSFFCDRRVMHPRG